MVGSGLEPASPGSEDATNLEPSNHPTEDRGMELTAEVCTKAIQEFLMGLLERNSRVVGRQITVGGADNGTNRQSLLGRVMVGIVADYHYILQRNLASPCFPT